MAARSKCLRGSTRGSNPGPILSRVHHAEGDCFGPEKHPGVLDYGLQDPIELVESGDFGPNLIQGPGFVDLLLQLIVCDR